MKIENQVTNQVLSNILRSKGICRKSEYCWVFYATQKKWVLKKSAFLPGSIHAYTLSELGEMIPFGHFSNSPVIKLSSNLWTLRKEAKKISFPTEADARAYYLINLLKTGEVTPGQINKFMFV